LKRENVFIWDKDWNKIDSEIRFLETVSKKDTKIDEMHDVLKEVDEIINHNQDAPEDIKDFKGKRWNKKNRMMDMEIDEMPIENIIKR